MFSKGGDIKSVPGIGENIPSGMSGDMCEFLTLKYFLAIHCENEELVRRKKKSVTHNTS